MIMSILYLGDLTMMMMTGHAPPGSLQRVLEVAILLVCFGFFIPKSNISILSILRIIDAPPGSLNGVLK